MDASGDVVPDTRDCSMPGSLAACDCEDKANDNPLCKVNAPTDQVRAKAYPGIRQLAVLKGLGGQAVLGSICPAQVTKPADADFGYRPFIASFIERMKASVK